VSLHSDIQAIAFRSLSSYHVNDKIPKVLKNLQGFGEYSSSLRRYVMSRKVFAQISVLALLMLAFLAMPASAQAGGVCGGTYVVDSGDTLSSIAARCGTSVSAITTANPGVADPLRSGQTLTLPLSTAANGAVTSSIVSSDTTSTYTAPSTNVNINNYTYNYAPPVTYNNSMYVVQYGDTFSVIASRYGLSINQLWAANPQIWNINYLYAGQILYIPTSSGSPSTPTTTQVSEPLSYGRVPPGTPSGAVRLINRSSSNEIYVSLQGTTRDGINVIFEYPVTDSLKVKVPNGSYTYVAWANEQQFVGYFHLGQDATRTLIFTNKGTTSE
jgi:LysM repeat protein